VTATTTDLRQRDLHVWPRYEAAALGFRNYWYPVTWSRAIGARPRAYRLLGEPVMLLRERGTVYAFYNQCPHRGIPLSVGRQDFPGTWSCRYHGWVFDLASGELRAALTDGPDSPICGKVRAKTYPVAERAGLVWLWLGEGAPTVPVEADIPEAFLHEDAVVVGRMAVRKGNWRFAAENGYDESHAKYLHRYGSLWTMFRHIPAWSKREGGSQIDADGVWLSRPPNNIGMQAEYPGLGVWPPSHWWKSRKRGSKNTILIRLPGCLVSQYDGHAHYEWYVPVDRDHHRYIQFLVTRGTGKAALEYRLRYWLYRRWLFHGQFNGQDGAMVELMPETGPERLYRPDASITAWRRLCEHARGETPAEAPLAEQLEEAAVRHGLTAAPAEPR
jgi:phenylpropionate dioxygenase-like ring-hydroxylating dioxygenase large terminal subunit